MKRLLLFILLMVTVQAWAAPPSRQTTYVSGTTIRSADVTGNEDAIFNYLQAGVDTIADGSVVNADINASASIDETKVNLGTVTQAITFTGNNTFAGTTIASVGTVTTGVLTAIDINGGSIDGSVIGQNAQVTIADADINGGTVDGVQIAGATATGVIFVNDASDAVAGLAQGTSGQALLSGGAGALPTWGSGGALSLLSTTSGTGTSTGDITIAEEKQYFVTVEIDVGASNITPSLQINSLANNYRWLVKGTDFVDSPTETIAGENSGSEIKMYHSTHSDASSYYKVSIYIDTFSTTAADGSFWVYFDGWHKFSGTPFAIKGHGLHQGDVTVSSFKITGLAANATHSVRVYEYGQ